MLQVVLSDRAQCARNLPRVIEYVGVGWKRRRELTRSHLKGFLPGTSPLFLLAHDAFPALVAKQCVKSRWDLLTLCAGALALGANESRLPVGNA